MVELALVPVKVTVDEPQVNLLAPTLFVQLPPTLIACAGVETLANAPPPVELPLFIVRLPVMVRICATVL